MERETNLPAPTDARPRYTAMELSLAGGHITVRDDGYSDRIRCDHPYTDSGEELGRALIEAARQRRRGRVVVFSDAVLRRGLEAAGFVHEATMPGYYRGAAACVVMGFALDAERAVSSDAEAVAHVDALVASRPTARERPRPATSRAKPEHAVALAELIAATFEHYPTPSGVPAYLDSQIREGVPFRFVSSNGRIVACASADLVRDAKTAELTDCATRPCQRGGGYMQAILADLMQDLRKMGYPTAFTLARACIPGVNLAFLRLGFEFRGRMLRSCRIGSGMEDMNVWSRRL